MARSLLASRPRSHFALSSLRQLVTSTQTRLLGACLLALLVLAWPRASFAAPGTGGPSAQPGNPATQVPRVADGPGVKVGKNSAFHGGFALSIGFDSNVFSEVKARNPREAAFGLPSGWLSIGNRPLRNGVLDTPAKRSERKVDYHLGVMAGWRLYMARRPTVWEASRLNVGVNLRVMFLPGRRFSVGIEEDVYRLGEAQTFEAGRQFGFSRIDHSAALRFIIRPSGGRFSLNLAYRNEILYFETPNYYRSNRLVNGVETEAKYRVRDRSALAVRYSFHDTYYFCCAQPGSGRNEDSEAHRVLGGYVGQLGKKVLLDVMAGYGWGLYKQDSNGPNHTNFIGYAALGYFPTPRTQLTLRVGRDFHDSIFGNYFADAGGSAAFTHVFNWNMRIDAGFGVWRRRYAGLPIPGQDTPDIVSYTAADGFVRKDTLISANLQVEQAFGRIWVVGARYSLAADLTDFATEFSNGFTSPAQFARNLVLVFAAVRY